MASKKEFVKNPDNVGALWEKTSAKGNTFFSGVVEIDGKSTNIVVFKNSQKEEGSNQPDYRILISKPKE